jgi:glycosyltransferase involved in cell wall biosynthesis
MNQAPQQKLSCAVGIATYKRPDILLECLRCVSQQTRIPDEVIIADASPDADATRERICRELPALPDATRFLHFQAPAGLPQQRNAILDQTQSDVILFLDDDSLASPEYVSRVTAVFEADTEGVVAGVEGVAVEGESGSAAPEAAPAPRPSLGERLRDLARLPARWVRGVLETIESRYSLPSFPEELDQPVHGVPEALKHLPVLPIRNLYGCVMSYRRPLACQYRFNENLKQYAYMEDFEISHRLGTDYVLLRRLDAPARHLRIQGGRLHPSLVRYLCLVNLTYICLTVMEPTPALRRHLERYAERNVQLELLQGCFRKTGFSQYRAVKAGLDRVRALLRASEDRVLGVYIEAAQAGFKQGVF